MVFGVIVAMGGAAIWLRESPAKVNDDTPPDKWRRVKLVNHRAGIAAKWAFLLSLPVIAVGFVVWLAQR